jgi:hypothetical protein
MHGAERCLPPGGCWPAESQRAVRYTAYPAAMPHPQKLSEKQPHPFTSTPKKLLLPQQTQTLYARL